MCDSCPRIDSASPYGAHISLTCRRHPGLRWTTKNISYIGARSIFYVTRRHPECACLARDLVPVRPPLVLAPGPDVPPGL